MGVTGTAAAQRRTPQGLTGEGRSPFQAAGLRSLLLQPTQSFVVRITAAFASSKVMGCAAEAALTMPMTLSGTPISTA